MARNVVENGYLLTESSPSQSYSYSNDESALFERIVVPAINGEYATTGGQKVYLNRGRTIKASDLDMYSASYTDVNGIAWTIYNEWDPDYGSKGSYVLYYVSSTMDEPKQMYHDSTPVPFTLEFNSLTYDPENERFTGNIRVYRLAIGGEVSYAELGWTVAELDRQFVPQIKREVAVTES